MTHLSARTFKEEIENLPLTDSAIVVPAGGDGSCFCRRGVIQVSFYMQLFQAMDVNGKSWPVSISNCWNCVLCSVFSFNWLLFGHLMLSSLCRIAALILLLVKCHRKEKISIKKALKDAIGEFADLISKLVKCLVVSWSGQGAMQRANQSRRPSAVIYSRNLNPVLSCVHLCEGGTMTEISYQEYVDRDTSFSVFLTASSLLEPKYQQEANSLCRTDDPCCPSITVQSLTHIYFLLTISPQACFLDSLETKQTCQRFLLVKDLAMYNPLIADHSVVFKPKWLPRFLIKRERV